MKVWLTLSIYHTLTRKSDEKREILTHFSVQPEHRLRAITEISDDIKLIPIDGTVADRLTEQYNGYVKHTIKSKHI